MHSKYDVLINNNTWTLVPQPPNTNIIGCKQVFRLNLKFNGYIDRYNAQLVAKGHSQQEGFDYFDTFSPVIKITIVRILFSIAISQK
ncbi:unnamed protein product [Spirodela intermedia]|uniref:Reverse transcriptase Ty1/copia-type domain-containing protein n=2 Tax=Spirodela intermedia TaxID=51605 RepID=A0A7I8JHV1_SPIIN|nr:unnamed protein product [Spirodela intermedia]CAA6669737.1 unnamed protein product [Spirodela intermedia]CAA7406704.1 unnamed protein product [Spirodela intermedia]